MSDESQEQEGQESQQGNDGQNDGQQPDPESQEAHAADELVEEAGAPMIATADVPEMGEDEQGQTEGGDTYA